VPVSGAHKWAYKHQKTSVAINISCLRHKSKLLTPNVGSNGSVLSHCKCPTSSARPKGPTNIRRVFRALPPRLRGEGGTFGLIGCYKIFRHYVAVVRSRSWEIDMG
jgi:hypothetical protein